MSSDPEQIRTIPNDYQYYVPLDPSRKEIRLITIEPGSEDDSIVLQIANISLEGPDIQSYECLSWCWGDLSDTKTIVLEHEKGDEVVSQPFAVTTNLESALRHLRQPDTYRVMWIDAICINQLDVQERTQQVGFMREVYQSAEWTSVWLGEKDEDVQIAVAVMHQLTERVESVLGIERKAIVGPDGFNFPIEALKMFEHNPERLNETTRNALHRMLESISAFFSRPWFKRIWVLQEVGSSSRTIVWVGNYAVEWGSIMLANFWQLARGIEYLHERLRDNPNRRSGILPQIWVGLTEAGASNRRPMLDLLFRVRQFRATDPRDHVFALLGLAEETSTVFTSLPELRPDYSKSCSQIYADFTRGLIKVHQTLDVLSTVDTYTSTQPRLDKQHNGHPSWTPSFDSGPSPEKIFGYNSNFRAAGDTEAILLEPDMLRAMQTLDIEGLKFDTVDFMTPEGFDIDTEFELWMNDLPCGLHMVWQSGVSSKESYPNGQDLLDAYIHTMTGGGYETKFEGPSLIPHSNLEADFAAYWDRKDPGMGFLGTKYIDKFLPLSKSGNAKAFGSQAARWCHDRVFFITKGGWMGLGPAGMRTGDHVVILHGGKVPYILRPDPFQRGEVILEAIDLPPFFEFIGESYVHGIMYGEFLEEQTKGGVLPQRFRIV